MAAERVQVGAVVDRPALDLLRRHEVGGAVQLAVVLVFGQREPEIGELDVAVPIDHQVVGLDVPVDDPHLLREAEAVGRVVNDAQRVLDRNLAVALEPLLDRALVHELHRVEVGVALVVDVIDLHDVGVVEPRRGARLGLEPRDEDRVLRQLGRQHLERDLAVEADLVGAVDLAHAALAEDAQQPEAPDLLRRDRLGRLGRRPEADLGVADDEQVARIQSRGFDRLAVELERPRETLAAEAAALERLDHEVALRDVVPSIRIEASAAEPTV